MKAVYLRNEPYWHSYWSTWFWFVNSRDNLQKLSQLANSNLPLETYWVLLEQASWVLGVWASLLSRPPPPPNPFFSLKIVLRLFNRWLLSTPCQWVKSGKYIQTKYIYSGTGSGFFKIPDSYPPCSFNNENGFLIGVYCVILLYFRVMVHSVILFNVFK